MKVYTPYVVAVLLLLLVFVLFFFYFFEVLVKVGCTKVVWKSIKQNIPRFDFFFFFFNNRSKKDKENDG